MLQMMDGHDMHQVFSIGNLKFFLKTEKKLMEENHRNNSQHAAKFDFSFPVTLCLLSQELSFSVFESLGVN